MHNAVVTVGAEGLRVESGSADALNLLRAGCAAAWQHADTTGVRVDAEPLLAALYRVEEAAGWSQEEIRRQAAAFGERLAAQRRELERGVEEGVRRAVARLTVPRRDQLEDFRRRLEDLSNRLDRLLKKR